MLIEDLIEIYGAPGKAAIALGLSRQLVHAWTKRGYIPYQSQVLIERMTNGVLKASKTDATSYLAAKSEYYPLYRYYSELHGMCPVIEIKFRKNKKPRILFSANGKVLFTYCNKNLMQASTERDVNGVITFENDIVQYEQIQEKHQYKFLTIENSKYLRNLKPFKIVGNIYEEPK